MYSTVMLSYSDYCTVLMLNAYMYEYYTWRIYAATAFSYLVGGCYRGWLGDYVLYAVTIHLTCAC